FSYMGTKKRLASSVADVIETLPDGPMLDGFSGMCAVGEAVGATRQIWNNDVQFFASTVAHALFRSRDLPPSTSVAVEGVFGTFEQQKRILSQRHAAKLTQESEMMQAGTI